MWNRNVKVITGVRGCGKTTLLFGLFKNKLVRDGVRADHIIEVHLDEEEQRAYRNPLKLGDYVQGIVESAPQEKFYVFVDEVQRVITYHDKELNLDVTLYDILNELGGYENLDAYVTASNAKMLSKDIGTEFRGRSTQIHLFPLSFEEFYSAKGGDARRALEEYSLYGGMPALTHMENEAEKRSYLSSLFDDSYIKDIERGYGIKKPDLLCDLLDCMAASVGSPADPKSISDTLSKKRGERVGNVIVSSYLDCCDDAFLVHAARRLDIKRKRYFDYPNKYYFMDVGLLNSRLGFRERDLGRAMETMVYAELLRKYYSVDVGVVTDRRGGKYVQREVSFVVNDGDRRAYIQVAHNMDTEHNDTIERRPLRLIGDSFKRVLIRDNNIYESHYDVYGFFNCRLIDFLMGTVSIF